MHSYRVEYHYCKYINQLFKIDKLIFGFKAGSQNGKFWQKYFFCSFSISRICLSYKQKVQNHTINGIAVLSQKRTQKVQICSPDLNSKFQIQSKQSHALIVNQYRNNLMYGIVCFRYSAFIQLLFVLFCNSYSLVSKHYGNFLSFIQFLAFFH